LALAAIGDQEQQLKTIFEDLGNGRTKLTFIGNEPMESAKNRGQMEGWNEILDKLAGVIARLAQG
jgi:hypothetical protein